MGRETLDLPIRQRVDRHNRAHHPGSGGGRLEDVVVVLVNARRADDGDVDARIDGGGQVVARCGRERDRCGLVRIHEPVGPQVDVGVDKRKG